MMSVRKIYTICFIVIAAFLALSFYLQLFDGMIPCPLCTLQRLTFGVLGIIFLLGAVLHRCFIARCFVNVFAILFSGLGVFFAGRQVWLQYFQTADSGECGVSLQYMMKILPWDELVQKVFAGSAECSTRGWAFLSLNMAEWALVSFAGFAILSLYLLVAGLRR